MSSPKPTVTVQAKQQQIPRKFIQNENLSSIYSDFSIVADTGNEVNVQFYQTQLGLPNEKGQVIDSAAILQSRIIIPYAHALIIYKTLGSLLEAKKLLK